MDRAMEGWMRKSMFRECGLKDYTFTGNGEGFLEKFSYCDFCEVTVDGRPVYMGDGEEPHFFGEGNIAYPNHYTLQMMREYRKNHGGEKGEER